MSFMALTMRNVFFAEEKQYDYTPFSAVPDKNNEQEATIDDIQHQRQDGSDADAPFILTSATIEQRLSLDMRSYLGLDNMQSPNGHTVVIEYGECDKERYTVFDDLRRIVFKAVILNGKRHGECYGWNPYGGGCSSFYDKGVCCGYSY
jgi:hypothetical protein